MPPYRDLFGPEENIDEADDPGYLIEVKKGDSRWYTL
jgi:hypothetical protein